MFKTTCVLNIRTLFGYNGAYRVGERSEPFSIFAAIRVITFVAADGPTPPVHAKTR